MFFGTFFLLGVDNVNQRIVHPGQIQLCAVNILVGAIVKRNVKVAGVNFVALGVPDGLDVMNLKQNGLVFFLMRRRRFRIGSLSVGRTGSQHQTGNS